jgi:ceramide glucosyltransferase
MLSALAAVRFLGRREEAIPDGRPLPPATILKPVRGLEKGLEANLRSACEQDHPEFQVVASVHDSGDAALPLLRRLEAEYGPERLTLAVEDREVRANGKIENLIVALPHARHEVLVISDSDVRLGRDYLATITAPLLDPAVGCVCTLYRAVGAERWFERLEVLTVNVDFLPSLAFATLSGASGYCLGASTALRRETLEDIGGFESLAEFLVEDYEMGRRIAADGKEVRILPATVDTVVGFESAGSGWRHQVYLDQNLKAARPIGYFATVAIRAVPFALLLALLRPTDPLAVGLAAGAVGIRLATAAAVAIALRDRETLRSLWLLPLRDVLGLASWAVALLRRRVSWRGLDFALDPRGRMAPLRGRT